MRCQILFEASQATLSNWCDDCAEIIDAAVQLLPVERQNRKYVTTYLRGFNLAAFLQEHGAEVQLCIADPSEHARLTVWTERLRHPRTDITDRSVADFLRDMKIEYRDLQRRGIKKILQSTFSILAALCGNGKTLMTLSTAQYLKKKNGRILVFIIAPAPCASEYIKELERFRGYFDLTINNTCGHTTRSAAERIADNECDLVLVSVDSVGALRDAIRSAVQRFNGEAMVVFEEGHAIKNSSSKRSKAAQSIAPLFDRVIISTATPLPLGPKDLRGYIATVGIPQPEESYQSGIPPRDFDLLRGVAFVTDEQDIPFAEMNATHLEYSDLGELNRKIAEEVRAELTEGRKVVIFTSTNAALQTAFGLFSDIPKTVLSGSFFVNDCETGVLQGGRDASYQAKAIEQFNFDERCKLLIANYRVGSTGLNLQYSQARMAVFYEITNCGADFFQSKYRIRRPTLFPANGFKYLYAIPREPNRRRAVNRQFLKLAEQRQTLGHIKRLSGGTA